MILLLPSDGSLVWSSSTLRWKSLSRIRTERSSDRPSKFGSDELKTCVRGAVWSRSMTRSSIAVTETFCGMYQLSAVKVSETGSDESLT